MGGIRALLMGLGIAVAPIAIGQDITYEISATTLKIALEEISKQGGTPMMVSGALADEIVTLRLKGATRAEFEKRLAATFRAEWQTESGGIRLIRSSQMQRQLKQAHFDLNLERVNKLIAKKKKELEDEKPMTEADIGRIVGEVEDFMRRGQEDRQSWETIQKIQKTFPSQRLMTRIATILDPKRLASFEVGDRLVFSTLPNGMQAPLPKEVGPLVLAALKDQIRLGDQIKTVVPEDSPQSWMFHGMLNQNPADQIAKALVIVSKPQWGAGYNLELRVVNQKGKYIFTGNTYLQEESMNSDAEELFSPKPDSNPSQEKPLPQSDIQKMITDYMKKMMETEGGRPGKLPPELRAVFIDPIKHEPLGFSFGDYAIQLAIQANKQLIAHPNDYLAMLGFYATMYGAPTATRLKKMMGAQMLKTKIAEDDAWIQVSPIDEVEAQQDFLPRKFYSQFIKRLGSGAKIKLDEWADMAARNPDDPTQKPLYMFSMILDLESAGDMMGPNLGWNRLRFYGLLSPAQRQVLSSGGFLTYGSLTLEQRDAVNRIVFRDDPNLEPPAPALEGGDVDVESMDSMYNGVFNEVTEQLPNGIPMGAQISLENSDQSGYFIDYSGQGHASTMFGTVDTIAWYIYQKENPSSEGQSEGAYQLDKFTLGAQRTLNFTIKLTKDLQKSWSLQDDVKQNKAQALTFDQLPESVRTEIRKKVEEIKKAQQAQPVDDPPGFSALSSPSTRQN